LITPKSLLSPNIPDEDEGENVKSYFETQKISQSLLSRFLAIKQKGDTLVVHRSSSSGILGDNKLFGAIQESVKKALKEKGYNIDNVSMLDRLAIVGESGMGALTYRPEWDMPKQEKLSSLDELSEQCQKILNTEYSDKLDELYRLGGTSGGARPKIMTKIDGEDWIIKFPAHVDGKNAGLMEYQYSQCAKQCGIDMEETRLFPSGPP
jgi:serine/threonine-protein kinase HipA